MTTRHATLWRQQYDAITASPGQLTPEVRRAIVAGTTHPTRDLERLLDKVRYASPSIVEADVRQAVAVTGDEDVVFEAVLAAALGAAELRLSAGLAAAGIRANTTER